MKVEVLIETPSRISGRFGSFANEELVFEIGWKSP